MTRDSGESLRNEIRSNLSSQFPIKLVEDLLQSYEEVLVSFRKGAWSETLWKAGKFVENVFRVLYFAAHKRVIDQVQSVDEMRKEFEKLPEEFPESVRILIPRIAYSMIYSPRSKKGAVHVKPVNPDFMDATLTASACQWILAELLRNYHRNQTGRLKELIQSIVNKTIPFVEEFDGQPFVTIKLKSAVDEILLLLLHNKEGMNRKAIGVSLRPHYSKSRISHALNEIVKQRLGVVANGKYYITSTGEVHISKVLSKYALSQ